MNGLLSQKIAIMLDEAYWAGSAKDKGKLRSLITCAQSTIRLMYTNPFKEQSFLRVFFMSNDEQVVPYDSQCERRYKCFELDNKYKGIQSRVTKAHFDPIYAIPDEVYALWLYHRDISGFSPRSFKVGAAETAQMKASLNPVEEFWYNCLDQGYVCIETERNTHQYDFDFSKERKMRRVWFFAKHYIPKQFIYAAYEAYTTGRYKLSNGKFFTALYKVVDSTLRDCKDKLPEGYAGLPSRPAGVKFEQLAVCRSAWEVKYGPLWAGDLMPVPLEAAEWVNDDQ